KDIVYVCNSTGVYFVTYNGGTTWHRVDAMLAALPNAKTTAATRVGSNATLTFSAVPAPVLKHLANSGGFITYCYNATAPLTVGSSGDGWDNVSAHTATTISVPVAGNRINNGRCSWDPISVNTGDKIYFGCGGTVAIDDGSGTVANPGIARGDLGAQGVA